MTREEAIAYGKRVIDLGLNDETQAFCEMAIKALKVIEDIKAEIIKLQTYKCFEDTEKLVALDEVLQIIEKYRGESKDADSD
ncbi:MAG: hypothetical protein IKE94_09490 [Aeriscardovia sp.]|nr:hypothetical protein [Aeriscardovia sp.]